MKPSLSARRAPLVAGILSVVMVGVVSAQSTSGGAAAPAATPGVTAPRVTAPGVTAPRDSSAPADAPRPHMGLTVPLTKPKAAPPSKVASKPSPYRNVRGTDKAHKYYTAVWGVDKLRANYTNSGNLIKFSYRVLQPKLAAALGDHENTPELIGIRSNAVLHIPTMEKIGQLRQLSAAQANKEYWMVFSNKGNLVKPGDEVSVIIGRFRADGLIVE